MAYRKLEEIRNPIVRRWDGRRSDFSERRPFEKDLALFEQQVREEVGRRSRP